MPDISEAHAFFIDVLGCRHLFTIKDYASSGQWLKIHLNVSPPASIQELRYYSLAGGPLFEVFEYDAPGSNTLPPKNSDIGGHHIALYTDDIDASVATLRAHGIRVLGDPTTSRGPTLGQRWVYFLSPWGMQFELVTYPDGRAFEKS